MPESLFTIIKPNFSTNATNSSSVSSTLPGSAMPIHDIVSERLKLIVKKAYLYHGHVANLLHGHACQGRCSQNAKVMALR